MNIDSENDIAGFAPVASKRHFLAEGTCILVRTVCVHGCVTCVLERTVCVYACVTCVLGGTVCPWVCDMCTRRRGVFIDV